MPVFSQVTQDHAGYSDAALVGDKHVIADRALSASSTFAKFQALKKVGSTWAPINAALIDSTEWVADTLTAEGDVVIPATRPVTSSSTGTGDGTITAAASATALAGVWVATCVAEASNAGTFHLVDPAGVDQGNVTVAVEAEVGGLTLTIADGANDWDEGDLVLITVAPLRAYVASAVAGDTKTHATTEPTWPTSGNVTDDQVTWTYLATVDDLQSTTDFGVLLDVDGLSTGSGETPKMPVVVSGQVKRSEIAGLPASTVAGDRLGLLILE
jgi:hypothetical protein